MSKEQNWQSLVWQQYGKNIRAILMSRIDNRADVEDLEQEILLKSYTQLHTLKNEAKLKPWLMSVTRNAIVDFYRNKRNQPNLTVDDLWYDNDGSGLLEELGQCVRPFIDLLPEETADLLKAVDIDGVSQKQLSEEESISYSGLKSRVQRGREQLRNLFVDCCEIEMNTVSCPSERKNCGC